MLVALSRSFLSEHSCTKRKKMYIYFMKLIKGFEFFTLNETTSFGACFGFNCIFLREMLGLQSFAVFKSLYLTPAEIETVFW